MRLSSSGNLECDGDEAGVISELVNHVVAQVTRLDVPYIYITDESGAQEFPGFVISISPPSALKDHFIKSYEAQRSLQPRVPSSFRLAGDLSSVIAGRQPASKTRLPRTMLLARNARPGEENSPALPPTTPSTYQSSNPSWMSSPRLIAESVEEGTWQDRILVPSSTSRASSRAPPGSPGDRATTPVCSDTRTGVDEDLISQLRETPFTDLNDSGYGSLTPRPDGRTPYSEGVALSPAGNDDFRNEAPNVESTPRASAPPKDRYNSVGSALRAMNRKRSASAGEEASPSKMSRNGYPPIVFQLSTSSPAPGRTSRDIALLLDLSTPETPCPVPFSTEPARALQEAPLGSFDPSVTPDAFPGSPHAPRSLSEPPPTFDIVPASGTGRPPASALEGGILPRVDEVRGDCPVMPRTPVSWPCTPPPAAPGSGLGSPVGLDENTPIASSSDRGQVSRPSRTRRAFHPLLDSALDENSPASPPSRPRSIPEALPVLPSSPASDTEPAFPGDALSHFEIRAIDSPAASYSDAGAPEQGDQLACWLRETGSRTTLSRLRSQLEQIRWLSAPTRPEISDAGAVYAELPEQVRPLFRDIVNTASALTCHDANKGLHELRALLLRLALHTQFNELVARTVDPPSGDNPSTSSVSDANRNKTEVKQSLMGQLRRHLNSPPTNNTWRNWMRVGSKLSQLRRVFPVHAEVIIALFPASLPAALNGHRLNNKLWQCYVDGLAEAKPWLNLIATDGIKPLLACALDNALRPPTYRLFLEVANSVELPAGCPSHLFDPCDDFGPPSAPPDTLSTTWNYAAPGLDELTCPDGWTTDESVFWSDPAISWNVA